MRTGAVVAALVAVVAVALAGCGPADNRATPTADLPSIKALPKTLATQGLILYWTGQWPLDKQETVTQINLQPGRLYAVTSNQRLMAMDSRTGQFLWDAELGNPGLAVTPVCQVGDRLAVVAVLDQLYGFDAVTGRKLFKRQLERTPNTKLVSHGDFVYYGTSDGWLEAVNVTNGSKNWSRWTDAAVVGAPAVDAHGVYLANTAGNLTSNSPKKRFVQWTYPALGRLGSVTGDLSISAGDLGLVLVPSRDYSLYAMNSMGGLPAWICTVGNPIAKGAHSCGSQIYFITETHIMYCVPEAHGEKPLWSANGIGDFVAASPANVYVRSHGKTLALDPQNGAVKFFVPTAGLNLPVTNDLDGQLFTFDPIGHVICLREAKGQYDLKPVIQEAPAVLPAIQPSVKKSATKDATTEPAAAPAEPKAAPAPKAAPEKK